MMGFININILFGLSLGLLPLIIHLLNRRKKRKIEFSSILLLQRIQKKKLKKIKLKQILLLIIRTLLVLSIVTAFARPLLSGISNKGWFQKGGVSLVFVMDNSQSSAGTTKNGPIYELNQSLIKKIINETDEGNHYYIVSMDEKSPDMITRQSGNRLIANKIIDNIHPSPFSLSWTRVFTFLQNEFKSPPLPLGRIFFITDGQPYEYVRDEYKNLLTSYAKTDFQWIKTFSGPVNNLRLDTAYMENPHQAPGSELILKAAVLNSTDQKKDNINIDLYINGKRAAQTYLTLRARSRGVAEFRVRLPEAKDYRLKFSLPDDEYKADNDYYLIYAPPEQSRVLIVNSIYSDSYHLTRAAIPNDSSNYLRIENKDINEIAYINENEVDLLILNQLDKYPDFLKSNMKKLIQKGIRIIVVPRTDSDITELNRGFFNHFNLGAQIQKKDTTSNNEYYSLKPNLSFTSFLSLQDPEYWKKIKIFNRLNTLISNNQKKNTFLSFENGKPAVMSFPIDNSEIIFFAFGLTEKSTNLTLHPMIVPFTHELIQYCVYSRWELNSNDMKVNTPLQLNQGDAVKRSGHKQTVRSGETGPVYLPRGQYDFFQNGETIKKISVNSHPMESDFNGDLNPGDQELKVIDAGGNPVAFIKGLKGNMEISYLFIMLALILFILESILSR